MKNMSRLNGSTLKVNGFLDEFEKDEVKKDVDIVSLFSSFGVELEKKGNGFMGKCPFHEDKTPSLSVDQTKGLFHCFGCGESGDVFDLVMKMKSLSFKDALGFLKDKGKDKGKGNSYSSAVVKEFAVSKPVSIVKPEKIIPIAKEEPKELIEEEEPKKIENTRKDHVENPSANLRSVVDYYYKKLAGSQKAIEYLKSRGFTDMSLINRLGIGFSHNQLNSKVSDQQYKELEEIGIFQEETNNKRGKESFAFCLTFPLFDLKGNPVGLYGRRIIPKARVKHLYLKGPHKGLFNYKAFAAYRERIILTESVIDALSLMAMGLENVSCIYGTNGVTSSHFKALKENRTKEIVLAFDNDEAGRKAVEDVREKFLSSGVAVRSIEPQGAKDWNEVLQTSPLGKEKLQSLISESELFTPSQTKDETQGKLVAGKYYFTFGEITYRLIGVKEGFVSSLKVNIRAEKEKQNGEDGKQNEDEKEKYIDNVDLFSARSRSSFSMVLGRLFRVESARVEKNLVSMLEWLEKDRDRTLSGLDTVPEIKLTPEEEAMGMELLHDPSLFDRIESDLSDLGYVGEASNKKLMYLAASSRKLNDPISIIVISQSAAGKSYLIDTVKKLIPPEEVLSMTSLSDQALNYLPEEALLHKFFIMGEAVHSDSVDHQMREMLSAKELSRLVTTKDEKTGKMTSKLVRKEVIVSSVMSSADGNINPENASRCFVITTDESEEQTKAIHRQQRRKYSLERIDTKKNKLPDIIRIHHAAQRLLRPVTIINPFAELLNFPSSLMRSRRDHERFIDLIASVCFLRQFQKEEQYQKEVFDKNKDSSYIECDLEDYRIAYDLMISILPSTLSNFPKSALILYETLREVIRLKAKEECLNFNEVSLTQREIREKTGLTQDMVKWNLRHLVEYEYIRKSGGAKRGQSGTYKIVVDEEIGSLFTSGIPEPDELAKNLRKEKSIDKKSGV